MRIILVLLLALSTFAAAQAKKTVELRARPTTFIVFPYDKKCSCIPTESDSATVAAEEVTIQGVIFQVFKDVNTKREVFRARIGNVVNGEEVKYSNYGLAEERDFNGDRRPDYAWYGGDDTSFQKLLVLSGPEGHKVVDVVRSVKENFNPGKPLTDLHLVSSNRYISGEVITKTDRGIGLGVTLNSDVEGEAPRRLLLHESQFVYQK